MSSLLAFFYGVTIALYVVRKLVIEPRLRRELERLEKRQHRSQSLYKREWANGRGSKISVEFRTGSLKDKIEFVRFVFLALALIFAVGFNQMEWGTYCMLAVIVCFLLEDWAEEGATKRRIERLKKFKSYDKRTVNKFDDPTDR